MANESQFVEVIKQAKESDKDRKFNQSVEMIMVFRDVDVKKGFAISETVQLPKKTTIPASVCIMASGDMGVKAKNAKADMVMDENELTKLSADKKKSKKLINKYDFFLSALNFVSSFSSITMSAFAFFALIPISPDAIIHTEAGLVVFLGS